jgi:hypothetical protein
MVDVTKGSMQLVCMTTDGRVYLALDDNTVNYRVPYHKMLSQGV